MDAPAARVAVVTGANRGIGLEVARGLARAGLHVVCAARDGDAAEAAAAGLRRDGGSARAATLDVADQSSVEALATALEHDPGRVDVLVNNAGVYPAARASRTGRELARSTLESNAIGPWMLAAALAPLLRRSPAGRIVNVSSEAGSLASMSDGHAPYAVSKAALNAVTVLLADELRRDGVLVNSVCPGWVRTDMGGAAAPRSVAEGAASVLWAALLPDDGPTGGFFRDGRPVPW